MWKKWIVISTVIIVTYNNLLVKVRICAGTARFGESVGIRGQFRRA